MVERTGYFDNIVKGRIAEVIVEELFKKSGYKVFRYGYESVLQNLTQSGIRLRRKDEIHRKIKTTPDFIVVSDGVADYVEVKFRTNGIRKEELDSWDEACLILVTPKDPYFYIVPVDEFLKGKSDLIPLEKDEDFPINYEALKKAKLIVRKYLTI